MVRKTLIHFVRHGEVENPSQVRYGRLPGFHLSVCGRQQVERTASSLVGRSIAAIYTSPLERTQQTATLLSFAWPHVPLEIDDRLIEVKTAHQFEGQSRDRHFYYPKTRSRDAETTEEIVGRLYRFLEEKVIRHYGEEIIAVSHGDPLALLYDRLVCGQVALPDRFYPTYASVMTVVLQGIEPQSIWYTCLPAKPT